MHAILGTIAIEPNRWTAHRTPATDVLDALPRIRAAGFDKLEVWQWHVTSRTVSAIRGLRARGDELGVAFPYIGVYPFFTLDGIEDREQHRLLADVLDKAEILGARGLKIMLPCGVKGSTVTPAQMARIVDGFGRWYREARSRGIGMCAELHGGTLFDPIEAGERFMREHPELDFSICYQPIDFGNTDASMALADRFAGRITHMHLQAPREAGGGYALLEDGRLDYRRLIPHILQRNPGTTFTLEFVKDCLPVEGAPFDVDRVLANASRDAEFVERVVRLG